MQINQKGEIVTIAVIATFVILGIATVATSSLTQNKNTAFISSSRAADASCYVGKACGIPACNDTMGGNSGSCSECNGGWCRGGQCATCGKNQKASGGLGAGGNSNDKPGTPNAEGKYKCRQRDNKAATYCKGGKSFIDTWCGGCAPEKNCKEVETCYNGVVEVPANPPQNQPQKPQSQPTLVPDVPPPATGGNNNSFPTQIPASTLVPTNDVIPTELPTSNPTNTCSVRIYFKDGQTSETLKNVDYTISQEGSPTSGGVGTSSDYYTTGQQYHAGKVTIKASMDGYISVDTFSTVTPSASSNFCNVNIFMGKTGQYIPSCPLPATRDPYCEGKCSPDRCDGINVNNIKCYTCNVAHFNPTQTPTSTSTPTHQVQPTTSQRNEGKLGEKCLPLSENRLYCAEGTCNRSTNTCESFSKNVVIQNSNKNNDLTILKTCFWANFSLDCDYYDSTSRKLSKGYAITYDSEFNKLCHKYYPTNPETIVSVELHYVRGVSTALIAPQIRKESVYCKNFKQGLTIQIK